MGFLRRRKRVVWGDEQELATRAAAGDADAMFTLSLRNSDHPALELEWLTKAAELGHGDALFRLGYRAECAGREAEAVEWWTKAADAGMSYAMFTLGERQEDAGDLETARSWYERGSSLGDASCNLWLGAIAENDGDRDTSRELYLEARRSEDTHAMIAFGDRWEREGRLKRAQKWYRYALISESKKGFQRDYGDCTYIRYRLARVVERAGDRRRESGYQEALRLYLKVYDEYGELSLGEEDWRDVIESIGRISEDLKRSRQRWGSRRNDSWT